MGGESPSLFSRTPCTHSESGRVSTTKTCQLESREWAMKPLLLIREEVGCEDPVLVWRTDRMVMGDSLPVGSEGRGG